MAKLYVGSPPNLPTRGRCRPDARSESGRRAFGREKLRSGDADLVLERVDQEVARSLCSRDGELDDESDLVLVLFVVANPEQLAAVGDGDL